MDDVAPGRFLSGKFLSCVIGEWRACTGGGVVYNGRAEFLCGFWRSHQSVLCFVDHVVVGDGVQGTLASSAAWSLITVLVAPSVISGDVCVLTDTHKRQATSAPNVEVRIRVTAASLCLC